MPRVVRPQRKGFGNVFRSREPRSLNDEHSEILAVLDLPIEKERAGNLYGFLERFKEIALSSIQDSSNVFSEFKEVLTEESLQLLKDHPLLNRENLKKRREEMQKECESISLDIEKARFACLKKELEEPNFIFSMREIDSLVPQIKLIQILETNIEDIGNVERFQEASERDCFYSSLLKVFLSMRKLLASDVL